MHSGRLIKNIGDGFFAVFEEVSAAIEFSAELLQTLQRNPILVGNEKISLRMALHTGAVQLQQTSYGVDLFGEAVIVAARLTACASPGRLVVSDVAFNALPVYLQTSFESVGEFLLKGTQDKIQVYTLILTGE